MDNIMKETDVSHYCIQILDLFLFRRIGTPPKGYMEIYKRLTQNYFHGENIPYIISFIGSACSKMKNYVKNSMKHLVNLIKKLIYSNHLYREGFELANIIVYNFKSEIDIKPILGIIYGALEKNKTSTLISCVTIFVAICYVKFDSVYVPDIILNYIMSNLKYICGGIKIKTLCSVGLTNLLRKRKKIEILYGILMFLDSLEEFETSNTETIEYEELDDNSLNYSFLEQATKPEYEYTQVSNPYKYLKSLLTTWDNATANGMFNKILNKNKELLPLITRIMNE